MYMFWAPNRLAKEIADVLQAHFGANANVKLSSTNIEIDIKDGYPREEKKLSQERLDQGAIGGGVKMELDGRSFKITVEEIRDKSL